MSEDENNGKNVSVSMPLGALGAATVLALAAAAYAFINRGEDEGAAGVIQKAKPGKGLRKKVGLMTVVTLIENDTTRKVVVAVLKAMARRS